MIFERDWLAVAECPRAHRCVLALRDRDRAEMRRRGAVQMHVTARVQRMRCRRTDQAVQRRITVRIRADFLAATGFARRLRSEEHTSELQSLMRISYAVFCLKKKNTI